MAISSLQSGFLRLVMGVVELATNKPSITIAGTNFATKYVVQTFEQDPNEGAILYNHDNEYLHYQDDWYVLAFKEEEYVLVYYRGSNDAWDGYGGAVLYSRSKTVPP